MGKYKINTEVLVEKININGKTELFLEVNEMGEQVLRFKYWFDETTFVEHNLVFRDYRESQGILQGFMIGWWVKECEDARLSE